MKDDVEQHGLERRVTDLTIRLGFLGLFIIWSLSIIAPFIGIVAWAVILTVALHPVYAWLAARLGGRGGLSAAIITVLGLALILWPVGLLAISLAETADHVMQGVRDGSLKAPPPPGGVAEWPVIGGPVMDVWSLAATNLEAAIERFGPRLLSAGGAALGQIASLGMALLSFAAATIISGFLFGSGPMLAESARLFGARVLGERGAGFVDMAGATIRNVSRGVIGVAIIQSLLAGVVMAVAGMQAAGALAGVMLVLCIVQVGGGPVLIPAILWAWSAWDPTAALLFTLAMVPIMLLDNVLKPIMMSRGLKTPMLVILIGVMGGALSYGLLGLFLGPIILAVFYELLVAWVRMAPPDAGEGE